MMATKIESIGHVVHWPSNSSSIYLVTFRAWLDVDIEFKLQTGRGRVRLWLDWRRKSKGPAGALYLLIIDNVARTATGREIPLVILTSR